jgi:hypothetical protein
MSRWHAAATANITLLRCRHHRWRCHCCRAAAKLLPTSRCHAAATAAASALLPPRSRRRAVRRHHASRCRHRRWRCRQRCTAAMLPPMLCCRHYRSLHAAATALPQLRCAPPPRFAPPPLTLPLPLLPRRRHAAADIALAFVDCYISINSDAFLSPHPTSCLGDSEMN